MTKKNNKKSLDTNSKSSIATTRHSDYSTFSSSSSSSASETSSTIDYLASIKKSKKSSLLKNEAFLSCDDEEDLSSESRKWNLNSKLNDLKQYQADYVKYFDPKEFNYSYIQQNGFQHPVLFLDKSGLDMRTPSKIFTVNDIKTCVGSKRIIDVIDCNTQQGFTMTMKEWCEYYEKNTRDRILNVISLEFSHTKLEDYVEAPLIVRQLDWIELAWPKQLRSAQTDSTNIIDKMKYPKVQKYVLMSVAECFTDFHIDMGGTSVWYHILKGEKIFWLIKPTEKNLEIYQKWILSGNQTNQFLADLCDESQRVVLKQGCTFMLPSGWIHAVYTSKDSIVFGGNFLHSFNIEMQLKIYKIEQRTKVPDTYRFPFYIRMLWFLIERYVHCFTGVTHLDTSCLDSSLTSQLIPYKTFEPEHKSVTEYELNGLTHLYDFILKWNDHKRNAPDEIISPDLLFQKLKEIIDVLMLKNEYTMNGKPFIHWPKIEKKYLKKLQNNSVLKAVKNENSFNETNRHNGDTRKHIMRNIPRTKGSIKKRLRPQNLPRSNVERRRRVRCHRCEPCTRDDCGECKYCKDMKKFGGTGISKQCCLSKQCFLPLLPTTTTCMACDVIIDRKHENESNLMFECEICFEIYHVKCFKEKYSHLNHIESIVNEDLNNCWKCANCVNKGYINKQNDSSNSIKLDVALQQPLILNTNSNFSDSLNNSFNSTRTNDMFVSPLSTTTTELTNEQPVKKKRYRRTKLEIENSKLNEFNQLEMIFKDKKKKKELNNNIKKQKNLKRIISIDSLSNYEKQIILNEFCEIYNEQDLQNEQNDQIEYDIMDDNSSAASVDNNYSMSTQNSFSNGMISDNDDYDQSMKYFDENDFDNELSLNDKNDENNNESLLKMIQAN